MANKFANAQNNSQENEEPLGCLREYKEFSGETNYAISESKSKRSIRWEHPQQALVLSVKDLQIGINGTKDTFFKATHGLEYRVPKRVVSLDEKYLRHCLELIHFRASEMARCNVSEKMGILSENIVSPSEARSKEGFDSAKLVFECPVMSETGTVVVGPAEQLILGSIMGSKSMTNILKSPLFNQYGPLDCNKNLTRLNSKNVDSSIRFDFMESPSVLSVSSSPIRLDKGTPIREVLKYDSDNARKKRVSMSSTNSVCSDQTSSTASGTICQAMLQCTWKAGIPHFMFSTDDQKDIYVANLWKVESRDEKALDYIYLFHSGRIGSKDHEICDAQSHLVGKMKVSTSFEIGSNNSKTLETEFVLFGGNDGHIMEFPTSSHCLRKHKGLPKKVVNVFRTSKTVSKFSGPCAIQENCSLDPGLDTGDNPDPDASLLDDNPPPNLELAAIVVKEHIVNNQKEEVGGWGLKFLKKVGVKQTTRSIKSSLFGLDCNRNDGDCSTSMNIIIPAGLHGGPRTRYGAPARLTERWKSGGQCDCGGWDIGCPLTVLKPKRDKVEAQLQDELKSFDFVTQGSDHGAPTLRLVTVQDNLYFVHFQRTLSILQSFSIAVAIVHTRSPTLRPRDVHEAK